MKLLGEYFQSWLERLEKARERGGKPEFTTSVEEIDELTGGLRRGHINIVGGPPSSGKTSIALQMAWRNAENLDNNVLFVSLETDGPSMVGRLFCNVMEVPNKVFVRGTAEDFPYKKDTFQKMIKKVDLQLVRKGYNFQEIKEIIKEGYQNKKPDVMFIDHLHQIRYRGFRSQNMAITSYVRDLHELATKYNIAIVLLSQVRKEGYTQGRRPKMSDLYGSGAIEQNAELVLMMYRELEDDELTHYLSIEKNRLGRMREGMELDFEGKFYKIRGLRQEVVV